MSTEQVEVEAQTPKRVVAIGTQKYSKIVCLDEAGAGGACHEYQVVPSGEPAPTGNGGDFKEVFADVSFQDGGVNEVGINGCHNEDLIAIVIDRLQHFQRGDFACRENALALTKLEEAMHWLNHRTQSRIARGVEGKSIK